jgi:hypothetical protein
MAGAHHAGITDFVTEYCRQHRNDPFDLGLLAAPSPMRKSARLSRLDIAGCRGVDEWGLESLAHLTLEELHVPSTCTDRTVRSIARSSS